MGLFDEYKEGYERNWERLEIRSNRASLVKKEAKRILDGKTIYTQIESRTGVPWWFVGVCHYRESSLNFGTYLGNGQPLGQRTTIVPKGRGPFTGPNAFVDGALDALRLEGFVGASDWGIARTLFRLEGFNGFGYHGKGVNSPYLYGGSTLYGPPEARAGKYVKDHVFDPNFADTQLGTAVILKALLSLDPTISIGSDGGLPGLEPDDEMAKNVVWLQHSLNALGADPQLVEDGRSGPLTRTALSRFQQQNGLDDTGLADPLTIAAIDRQLQPSSDGAASDIREKLESLQAAIRALTDRSDKVPSPVHVNTVGVNSDLAGIVSALGGAVQRVANTVPPVNQGGSQQDRLRRAIDLVSAILLPGQAKDAPLGPVNGALGQTIGNLLDGKKSAIGIGGAIITQLLSKLATSPGVSGDLTAVGTALSNITPAMGLSPFAMPLFLGLAAWGFLGKLEKWNQGMPTIPLD
ncbi:MULTISPECIES: peptidoglycan-binding protein [unclassified Mesorhizobium]|uniref:peptidoglycan-binding protein n=1 Tax=unclassified Mesorhizobium TaxID=325217 RepID=UPI000BAFD20A|nr:MULTISPECIES: peptidoglycan-binding protein [unclassified Mesorhizobium]PBC21665.1 peptidoglycan-binding protein [Mesorhizobium sp. WSM4311]TRD01754.1 peptidoglycan-binding protein [Mesorhizobium sp. WSM4305]